MAENKKYNYNSSFGRIEFLANLKFIKDRLARGYTFKSVYSELVKAKKITCSYKSLSRYKTIFLGFSNNCKGKRETQNKLELNKKSNQLIKKNKRNNQNEQNQKETTAQITPKNSQQKDEDRPFREEDKSADELV